MGKQWEQIKRKDDLKLQMKLNFMREEIIMNRIKALFIVMFSFFGYFLLRTMYKIGILKEVLIIFGIGFFIWYLIYKILNKIGGFK